MMPYTVETFPLWAVWIRHIGSETSSVYSISRVNSIGVYYHGDDNNEIWASFTNINNFEIAGTDGVWKPFYTVE